MNDTYKMSWQTIQRSHWTERVNILGTGSVKDRKEKENRNKQRQQKNKETRCKLFIKSTFSICKWI